MLSARQIRQGFLDYFAARGHRVVASSSLVPAGDPTLLFTNAGMNQFKDVFLGREHRDYRRATTAQKCMRVSGKHNDLDAVGPSLRHHTFFEMLGNFSFGDYFKQDAIAFAWELLTTVWHLDPDRLYPTVFGGEAGVPLDEDAIKAWAPFVPAARLTELGASENFWQMGETGPCGRCSEIHYFRGLAIPCPEPVCLGVSCRCERYVEVWNNVFMEFNRDDTGRLVPLPAASVDTGMGLERVTAVIQGRSSNYDTDLFTPILDAIGRRAGRPYTGAQDDPHHPDVSMRVIADHLRAMTFLIADGVVPSNEWRGYVLRKIMRRAMRHGKTIGLDEPFLHGLVPVVVAVMGPVYPELVAGADHVVRLVRAEEDRFEAVLTKGLPALEDVLDRTQATGSTTVAGEDVFRLYDSLGVPYDYAEDLASERGLAVDRQAFDEAMAAQRERARAGAKFTAAGTGGAGAGPGAARAGAIESLPELEGLTDTFVGYDTTSTEATLLAWRRLPHEANGPGGESGGSADRIRLYVDRTPFYAEAGGQVSDTGTVLAGGAPIGRVLGVERPVEGRPRAHLVEPLGQGRTVWPAPGSRVTLSVDVSTRDATRRNHTATHLLHAALRQRLGPHVHQKGSLVVPDRLRFDFSHHVPLTVDERRDIETTVNEHIYLNSPVTTEVRRTEDAITSGAMALFGEKYGDRVRVVTVAGFSVELCGGTHVRATGDIGPFVITDESGVAAGVRRIEALTGAGAVAWIQAEREALDRATAALNVPAGQAVDAIVRLQAEAKRLTRENERLRTQAALAGPARAEEDDRVTIGSATLIARRVGGLERGALRGLSDSLRDRVGRGVVVLAADHEGKVSLVVSVTKDLTDRVKAGQLVKELAPIVGGGGGGRPDFAEAGGKDATKIDAMLSRARELVKAALAS